MAGPLESEWNHDTSSLDRGGVFSVIGKIMLYDIEKGK